MDALPVVVWWFRCCARTHVQSIECQHGSRLQRWRAVAACATPTKSYVPRPRLGLRPAVALNSTAGGLYCKSTTKSKPISTDKRASARQKQESQRNAESLLPDGHFERMGGSHDRVPGAKHGRILTQNSRKSRKARGSVETEHENDPGRTVSRAGGAVTVYGEMQCVQTTAPTTTKRSRIPAKRVP